MYVTNLTHECHRYKLFFYNFVGQNCNLIYVIISLISLSVTGKFPVICNELFLSGGAIKSSTVTCLESK